MSNKAKPSVGDLFGNGDSDDEHAPLPQHAAKRHRSQEPTPPAPDMDPKVVEVADKLADFVAKNGRKYEDITRERNPGNTPFKFLWDKSSREYKYYESKLHELLRQAGPPAGVPPSSSTSRQQQEHSRPGSSYAPAPAAHHQQQQHSSSSYHSSHSTQPRHSSSSSSGEAGGKKRSRWESGPPAAAGTAAGGSSAGGSRSGTLSAMEEYMRRLDAAAAQKKREEEEEEEERRRRAAQPLLKETAFDRRKVVAVYKEDGERGHHMDDFIPKEELAKFMAQCGNNQLQKQVEAQSTIGADNVGHKLLQKMGWKEGKGIGAKEDGRTAPVAAAGPVAAAAAGMKQDTLGLGAQAHGAVEATDDPFEQYRKRMMLGYKYRPNPLGNPRKPYY